MDKPINKTQIISGLFGLITAKLEEAHGTSINGQGINTTLEIKQEAINELHIVQEEIEILVSAIEMKC